MHPLLQQIKDTPAGRRDDNKGLWVEQDKPKGKQKKDAFFLFIILIFSNLLYIKLE